MNPRDVYAKVRAFMQVHPAGWTDEGEVLAFLNTSCPLRDICVSLTQISDLEEIDVMIRFLQSVVRYESVSELFTHEELKPFTGAAAQSPNETLRKIVVDAYASVSRESLPLETDIGMLMGLLRDEDTGVSQSTNRLILKWVTITIRGSDSKIELTNRMLSYYSGYQSDMNETDNFRFISLFIELGRQNSSLFEIIRSRGVYFHVIEQFLANNSDLLVKLGSLTFIESLSQFEAGQRFLADSKVLSALESELVGPLSDSTTVISLLYSIASIIPFIQDASQVTALLSAPSHRIPAILSTFLVSLNNAERMCAIKVFGILGQAAGRNAPVESFMRRGWKSLNQIIYALHDTDVEVVNTALDALHAIVKGWERNPFMESEVSQNQLTEAVLETFRRHPFPECRCLVYALLGAMLLDEEIADSALAKILYDPSPIRVALLDYKSEAIYEARRAKCDFVRVLVKMEEKDKLKRYFKKDIVEDFIDFAEKGLEWVPISKGKDEMETEAT